jgi:hypothetical protein
MLRHSIEYTKSPFEVRPMGSHTGSFTDGVVCANAGVASRNTTTANLFISFPDGAPANYINSPNVTHIMKRIDCLRSQAMSGMARPDRPFPRFEVYCETAELVAKH